MSDVSHTHMLVHAESHFRAAPLRTGAGLVALWWTRATDHGPICACPNGSDRPKPGQHPIETVCPGGRVLAPGRAPQVQRRYPAARFVPREPR